jgi:hypothetical protein
MKPPCEDLGIKYKATHLTWLHARQDMLALNRELLHRRATDYRRPGDPPKEFLSLREGIAKAEAKVDQKRRQFERAQRQYRACRREGSAGADVLAGTKAKPRKRRR